MTVLWQSFLDPDDHRPYLDALAALIDRAIPGLDIELAGIRPPDRHLHALTEVRCGIAALRNALWAERNGYDAVVIGHFQEPFLHELRASVGIPVVGLGEAALAEACARAERFAIVTIDEVFLPWHAEQVRRAGLDDRVVGIASLGVTPDRFMAAMSPGEARQELLVRLGQVAGPLAAGGAEALLPGGALPAVALCSDGEIVAEGIPFLDCVGAAARRVEHEHVPGTFSRPPEAAVEEFLAATGGPLSAPVR